MKPGKSRIALIGCNGVETVDVFSLAKSNWLDELVLVGDGNDHLQHLTNGLLTKWTCIERCSVSCGTLQDAAIADVAILNVVSKKRKAERRSEWLKGIAKEVRTNVRALVQGRFAGVLLVITEPVDVMALVALRAGQFEAGRVMGLGDGNGPKASPAEAVSALWCSGARGNTNFLDHCDPNCSHFERVATLSARSDPAEFRFTGNRVTGMALCVTRVCEAVIKNEHELLPVSAFLGGEYGASGIFMTVPCTIGRNGVERIIELPLSADERRRMHTYDIELRTTLDDIGPDWIAMAAQVR